MQRPGHRRRQRQDPVLWSTCADRDPRGGRAASAVRCSPAAGRDVRLHAGTARPGRCCRRRCRAAEREAGGLSTRAATPLRPDWLPMRCVQGAGDLLGDAGFSINAPITEHISPAPARPNGYRSSAPALPASRLKRGSCAPGRSHHGRSSAVLVGSHELRSPPSRRASLRVPALVSRRCRSPQRPDQRIDPTSPDGGVSDARLGCHPVGVAGQRFPRGRQSSRRILEEIEHSPLERVEVGDDGVVGVGIEGAEHVEGLEQLRRTLPPPGCGCSGCGFSRGWPAPLG